MPSDLQAVADRFEIEALRGEFTDASMMRDWDRFASLFTEDGAWRMPHINEELVSREEIRAGVERLRGSWEFFVRTVHPARSSSTGTPRWVVHTSPSSVAFATAPRTCTTPVLKLTFAKGASLTDPAKLFNASLAGNTRRAIDIHEGEKVKERAFKALIRAAVAFNTSSGRARSRRAK